MKLTTKSLWIPAGILVATFLIMGIIFSQLVISYSTETQAKALTRLINSNLHELRIGIALVSSTQGPANAMIGLEGDDDSMAKELMQQVESMGLDAIYLTDLAGKAKFSTGEKFPKHLTEFLKKAPEKPGSIGVSFIDGSLDVYSPVIDVDTAMGYLVFSIKIPEGLYTYAQASVDSSHDAAGDTGAKLTSQYLSNSEMQLEQSANNFLNSFLITVVITLIIALALILGVLGFTSQNIIRPIKQLLTVTENMANGDLTQHFEIKSKDEIGQLQAATQSTINQLHQMINDVNTVTNELSTSSERMASITTKTNDGIQTQRQDTEQVATAINQMTSTIQGVAQHAVDAADAAKNADSEASAGHSVVNQTAGSIDLLVNEIEKASGVIQQLENDSDSIGSVLDVIKGIAEQTNLLALNAAIEAARAGEQGRGFAVVADEVRVLASRTQESAQEIQGMIERLQAGSREAVVVMTESQNSAKNTVDQAAKAGESLQSITTAVTTINDMNTQIASASEEQSVVADEINKNISNIHHVAEMSADGAQQLSQATQELNVLSDKLGSMVGRFKL